jgi:hypothetical protein
MGDARASASIGQIGELVYGNEHLKATSMGLGSSASVDVYVRETDEAVLNNVLAPVFDLSSVPSVTLTSDTPHTHTDTQTSTSSS